jgi:methyl-accepting chemotaxis protein
MRVLGWLAMIVGVIGIVVGLALVPAALLGKSWVEERANHVIDRTTVALERALEIADQADATLDNVTTKAAEIQATAEQAATNLPQPGLLDRLSTAVNEFVAGPWTQLQTTYNGLSERLLSITDAIKTFDQAIPGVSLPRTDQAVESLHAINARMDEVNTTVLDIQQRLAEAPDAAETAATVAQAASRAQDGISTIQDRLGSAQDEVETILSRLATLESRLSGWTLIGSIVLLIFGLYLAGLNVLLFQQGRRWARSRQSSAETPPLA